MENIEQRLTDAIRFLQPQILSRSGILIFERLAVCVNRNMAYREDRDSYLPFSGGRPLPPRTRRHDKISVVFHEVCQAIILFWDWERTHVAPGLEHLVSRIEDYAEYGYKNCDLVGNEDVGYSLFIPPELREKN